MGETARHKQLAAVVGTEFHCHMPAECFRSGPKSNRHIKHTPAGYPHKLGLRCIAMLEMQTSYDPTYGIRFVILHEFNRTDYRLEITASECLAEISAIVAEPARFYNPYAIYWCFYKISH